MKAQYGNQLNGDPPRADTGRTGACRAIDPLLQRALAFPASLRPRSSFPGLQIHVGSLKNDLRGRNPTWAMWSVFVEGRGCCIYAALRADAQVCGRRVQSFRLDSRQLMNLLRL